MRSAVLLLALVLAALSQPASAEAASGVSIQVKGQVFSPNGDGVRDTVGVFYYLERDAATVTLDVRGSYQHGVGYPRVAVLALGGRQAGGHWLQWDGRDQHGRTLPDGSYGLRITARHEGHVWRSSREWVGIDTKVRGGTTVLDWPVVYPRSRAVADRVLIQHVSPFDGAADWSAARGWIVDPAGRVVHRMHRQGFTRVCDWFGKAYKCGTSWAWSARRHGRALPAGRYHVVVVAQDEAGNTDRARSWVRVSAERLVPTTTTTTVTAADSVYDAYDPLCNSCGDDWTCGDVVAPGRFGAGSLSYRSADTCPDKQPVAQSAHAIVPAAAPALGDYRVTAYGGPTTPGAADQGELLTTFRSVLTGDPSDHETTLPWVRAGLRGLTPAHLRWAFRTNGTDAYDVAWFRVEYVSYAPPAAAGGGAAS